jgi:hypothetical protein
MPGMTNISLEQLEFVVGGKNQGSSPDAATEQLKSHASHVSSSSKASKVSEPQKQK